MFAKSFVLNLVKNMTKCVKMCFVENYNHIVQWIGRQRGVNYRQCKNVISFGVYLNESYTSITCNHYYITVLTSGIHSSLKNILLLLLVINSWV